MIDGIPMWHCHNFAPCSKNAVFFCGIKKAPFGALPQEYIGFFYPKNGTPHIAGGDFCTKSNQCNPMLYISAAKVQQNFELTNKVL